MTRRQLTKAIEEVAADHGFDNVEDFAEDLSGLLDEQFGLIDEEDEDEEEEG